MSNADSEDEFPNDFDGLDFSTIPALQELPVNEPALQSPVPRPSSASTSSYDLGDDVDLSFLAAVDAIEARALREVTIGTTSQSSFHLLPIDLHCKATHPSRIPLVEKAVRRLFRWPTCSFLVATIKTSAYADIYALEPMSKDSTDQTRKRCIEPSEEPPSLKKGKMKAEIQEDLNAILEGYEDEIVCPICCDILVAAHMASPCGHTYCGECGYVWLSRNKYSPTCAVCRANLTAATPLLPNFVVDSIVRQHVQALARSGRPDWQQNGYRLIEWNRRLE
ncbi:hypothetical protein F5I97DRAFT_1599118 [Phlebopus sp. FC_14]|nr:hypothetical protein F5I97DRAFT_1599118 [Phlebopus sp. FC_14]